MSENSIFVELRRLNLRIESLEEILRPGPPRRLEHEGTERQLAELRNQRDSLLEILSSLYDP